MAFDFKFDFNGMKKSVGEDTPAQTADTGKKRSHRRVSACEALSLKYEYRRAWSEVQLLEAMKYAPLDKGRAYHFITGGDVDSVSFLKVILNRKRRLDYLLMSSWVISAEDALQLRQWYEAGRIGKLDMYLGEIFPNQYKIEFGIVSAFYRDHPEAGRFANFKNHCKVFAGCCEADDFYFGIQTSANANTNPRIEQASIVTEKKLFEFYKEFFDGINSFTKTEE